MAAADDDGSHSLSCSKPPNPPLDDSSCGNRPQVLEKLINGPMDTCETVGKRVKETDKRHAFSPSAPS
ncbi:hypothetical protein ColTof4_07679 [Colletotrichum tofieldiae]|nr:hypothetical protein ColTof3_02793 [Colletotrichum tofieldiae]GKT75256.1 hypothetical protein ColTof4_07679 [Colletotrichum tofieldiae]GKT82907.1 hypothetical protein Ct61P_00757 [Colletotrichum tofieldiae]